MPRGQDRPDQRRDVVVALAERLAQGFEQGVGGDGALADEELIELADDEAGRGGLLEQDADHVVAVPGAGPPEDRLAAAVVEAGVEGETDPVGPPAGEGAGGLADVLL